MQDCSAISDSSLAGKASATNAYVRSSASVRKEARKTTSPWVGYSYSLGGKRGALNEALRSPAFPAPVPAPIFGGLGEMFCCFKKYNV